MTTPENPFRKGEVIGVDTELLEAAHTRGLELAGRLALGDVEPLPGEVLAWLTEHTEAINTPNIGDFRGTMAEKLSKPPFSDQDAAGLAEDMQRLIKASNDRAVSIMTTDVLIAEQFKVRFPQFFPPEQ